MAQESSEPLSEASVRDISVTMTAILNASSQPPPKP
jgi:hypothetical protein